MNIGPNHPSGGVGGGGRGKGRRRRPQGGKRGGPGHAGHGGSGGHSKGAQRGQQGSGIYSSPMDHAYRAAMGQNGGQGGRNRMRGGRNQRPAFGTQYLQPEPEPLPAMNDTAAPRIFAFVDDLFFLAKIQETARKLNVKVEFVKNEKDILDRVGANGEQKPALIIVDLNITSSKPLTVISRLKSKLKKHTSIIGFLSHVQGDLKVKAQEAGCDMVLPRSAFSQNLPQLLRRHGAPEEPEIL
jgi:CheY-like chemotaxis protein